MSEEFITNRKTSSVNLLFYLWTKVSFMEGKVQYWIEMSDYDFETAEAMLRSKRYLYVGFMCHQTIEKAFKAYFTRIISETAPFSHSLSYLAKKMVTFMSYSLRNRKTLLTKLSL
jgi:HEPN domain-containing protein